MWTEGVHDEGLGTTALSIRPFITTQQQGEHTRVPRGPVTVLARWSTVESSSRCSEAPSTAYHMICASPDQRNPMQSSVGAAGGAGGLARVPPERAATNRGWLVHGARAGVGVGYVVRRIGRERRGRRASPLDDRAELTSCAAGASRLGLLRRHRVVSLQVPLRHRRHPELAYRSASALDSRSKFTGVVQRTMKYKVSPFSASRQGQH